MKDEDYIEHLLVANSHATLLLFSSKGKVYWLRTFEIPEASRTARGRPLVNLLPLDEGERITAMLQIDLEALQQNGGADDDLDEAEGAVLGARWSRPPRSRKSRARPPSWWPSRPAPTSSWPPPSVP